MVRIQKFFLHELCDEPFSLEPGVFPAPLLRSGPITQIRSTEVRSSTASVAKRSITIAHQAAG